MKIFVTGCAGLLGAAVISREKWKTKSKVKRRNDMMKKCE